MQICKWYRANVSQNLPLTSKQLTHDVNKGYFTGSFNQPMPSAFDVPQCDGGDLMSIPLLPGTGAAWEIAYRVNDYFWSMWQAG